MTRHLSISRAGWAAALVSAAVSFSCGGAESVDVSPTPSPVAAPTASADASSPPSAPSTSTTSSGAPSGEVTISVYAGTGSPGLEGDGGLAAEAKLYRPTGVTVDRHGNLFITEGDRIRRVDAGTGVITTVAGGERGGYGGDGGPATDAKIRIARGPVVDPEGDLYFADFSNGRIRRVDADTGVITTVAGGGPPVADRRLNHGDGGPATEAYFLDARVVTLDAQGNLYFSADSRIRRVDAETGIITTVAGIGRRGMSGDGGPAIEAQIANPDGIAVAGDGTIYFTDSENHRVRKVDATTGIITTVAGLGYREVETSSAEYHLPADKGGGFSGDGGPAADAMLLSPGAVVFGPDGKLYIADTGNDRIRVIDLSTGIIDTVADGGAVTTESGGRVSTTFDQFTPPSSIAVNAEGVFFIDDPKNNRVLKIER